MKVTCFRRNAIIEDIYQRYSNYFERSDDLLIPDEPIERYLLVKEPTVELKKELNDYIETLDRKQLEAEFIKRMAYNKFLNLSEKELNYLSIYPDEDMGFFGYISTRNDAVNCMPLDFWYMGEFEDEAALINKLLLGHVLNIDMTDSYYKYAFYSSLPNYWCMYSLMFKKSPKDILDKYYGFEDGIDRCLEEIKSHIMDITRATRYFDSLNIDLETQFQVIKIIDDYCKNNKDIVIPYEILCIPFINESEQIPFDLENVLVDYNKYARDLYNFFPLLPLNIFTSRRFMKLSVQINGNSILRNKLYQNDDEIVTLAIEETGSVIKKLSKKYFKDESLMLKALRYTWFHVFDDRMIRNYWKNNLDFAYKALDIDSSYYKYFSLKIRNNEEFIKYALFKNDSYDVRFKDIYNAFSRKNKTKIKWVIDAMENDIFVYEECLSKKILDNDELAEYCYNNDPYKLYHFSKRIRAKYPDFEAKYRNQ